MVNVTSLETTRHGTSRTETLRSKPMTAYTTANLVDLEKCPSCGFYLVDGECYCDVVEEPQKPPQSRVEPATPTPRKVSSTHWIVDSFTTTLVAYHLRLNEYGVWMCSCPDFNRRNKLECKHSRLLCAYLDELAGRDAQKPATPIVEAKAGVIEIECDLTRIFDGHQLTPVEKRRETLLNKRASA